MPKPHGGRLVNRAQNGTELERIREEAGEMPRFPISMDIARECENIANGVYSPLRGFMVSNDNDSVIDHMRLPGDEPWTIPIILDADTTVASEMERAEDIALVSGSRTVAIMRVEETYPIDRKKHASCIYGTTDPGHPGVTRTNARRDMLVGGDITLLDPPDCSFPGYHLAPLETRVLFRARGWRTVVGFQTRNVPHLGHEYLQKTALSFTDGLLINPVIGKKKPGDFTDRVIIDAYDVLIRNYYLRERAVLVTLQFEMRYAGPREAILHAIVRKNYGCTHFIVGRDHAGVGSYYHPYAAQEIFDEFPDLGISPIFFTSFFHCRQCGGVANDKTCPHGEDQHTSFSGTAIRKLLVAGRRPTREIMRPEIADLVLEEENPFVS